MEFLKHELVNMLDDDDNDEPDSNAAAHYQQSICNVLNQQQQRHSAAVSTSSSIRRCAARFMASNRFFQQERDQLMQQRLVFVAILHANFEQLFNAQPAERGPLWEQVRQFMVEQGAVSLLDKDWKYVAGCYWQNIRKESIRRTVKLRVGAIKQVRPALLELDRMVAEVLDMRGPGSYDQVLRHYGRFYANFGEEQSQDQEGGDQQHVGATTDTTTISANDVSDAMGDGNNNSSLLLGGRRSLLLSNSVSPAMPEELQQQQQQYATVPVGGQAALDQMVQTASNRIAENNQQQQQQRLLVPINIGSTTSKVRSSAERTAISPPTMASTSAPASPNQLSKMVLITHTQLLAGGYQQMAVQFERQLTQMVNGYKAWMFDQLYGGGGGGGNDAGGQMTGSEMHHNKRGTSGGGGGGKKQRLS